MFLWSNLLAFTAISILDPMTVVFQEFTRRYNKTYTLDEVSHRFQVFKNNLALIEAHNGRPDSTYTLDLNEWADLTWAEFSVGRKGLAAPRRRPSGRPIASDLDLDILPTAVDWRKKGAVNTVKDQQSCGSCWAFSAVAAVEFAWFQKNHTLLSLSEQQFVDCDTSDGNEGCAGGSMDSAFLFAEQHALCTEADYPYVSSDQACKKTCKGHVEITKFVDVPSGNETALAAAVAQRVVSVGIEADQPAFQFYSSGVFNGNCGTNLDHGVAVVGYGHAAVGGDYWIVRNSWGLNWGEQGYIRLARGKNQCGISLAPSYPTGAHAA